MKDDEFKKRLSEVAEWRLKDYTDVVNPDMDFARRAAEKRRKARGEELELEEMDEEPVQEVDGDRRLNIELVKVKIQPCWCEDCGKLCENGRHQETRKKVNNHTPHWRKRCLTCDLYFNPFTEKYDLKQTQASQTWLVFLRDGNRLRIPIFLKKE